MQRQLLVLQLLTAKIGELRAPRPRLRMFRCVLAFRFTMQILYGRLVLNLPPPSIPTRIPRHLLLPYFVGSSGDIESFWKVTHNTTNPDQTRIVDFNFDSKARHP